MPKWRSVKAQTGEPLVPTWSELRSLVILLFHPFRMVLELVVLLLVACHRNWRGAAMALIAWLALGAVVVWRLDRFMSGYMPQWFFVFVVSSAGLFSSCWGWRTLDPYRPFLHVRPRKAGRDDVETYNRQLVAKEGKVAMAPVPFFVPDYASEAGVVLLGGEPDLQRAQYRDHVRRLQRMGIAAVVIDPMGETLAECFRPGVDVILAPDDARSARWKIGEDILTDEDLAPLIEVMFPATHNPVDEPVLTPRELFTEVARYLLRRPNWRRHNSSVWARFYASRSAEIGQLINMSPILPRWRALTDAQRFALHGAILERVSALDLPSNGSDVENVSLRRLLVTDHETAPWLYLTGTENDALFRRAVASAYRALSVKEGRGWILSQSRLQAASAGLSAASNRYIVAFNNPDEAVMHSALIARSHRVFLFDRGSRWVESFLPVVDYESMHDASIVQTREHMGPASWRRLAARRSVLATPVNAPQWLVHLECPPRALKAPSQPAVIPRERGTARAINLEPLAGVAKPAPPQKLQDAPVQPIVTTAAPPVPIVRESPRDRLFGKQTKLSNQTSPHKAPRK